MMANDLPAGRRWSYGEGRKFGGLEHLAIRSRLVRARKLLELLNYENPGKELYILELGCGFLGSNLLGLSKDFVGVNFTGVDLKVAKETNEKNIQLIEADITDWKPDRSFDGVLSLAIIEHLLNPSQHFKLIARCLREGGLAGLTTPAPSAHLILEMLGRLGIFDQGEIKDHQMYFTANGLRNLAKSTDLTVEEYGKMSFGFNQWLLLRKK